MHEFVEYIKKNGNKAENTLIAYDKDIRAFESWLEDKRGKSYLECLESDAVAYVMALGKEKKSKATVNRKISALRAYYDYLIDFRRLASNPFAGIKYSRNDSRVVEYLTIEELEQLLALPEDSDKGRRDRALLEFMYGTGARVSELVRLTFEDVNLKMGFVTLKDAEDESRLVPLGSFARDALNDYVENTYTNLSGVEPQPDNFVFVNMRGEALTRQGVWKILKLYGEALNMAERMTPQILRDSFAVHILQNGGDLKTLQELMGFDDMSVGIAYLSVTEIHVRDVFKRCHPRA